MEDASNSRDISLRMRLPVADRVDTPLADAPTLPPVAWPCGTAGLLVLVLDAPVAATDALPAAAVAVAAVTASSCAAATALLGTEGAADESSMDNSNKAASDSDADAEAEADEPDTAARLEDADAEDTSECDDEAPGGSGGDGVGAAVTA